MVERVRLIGGPERPGGVDVFPAMGEFICWVLARTCTTARPIRFAGPSFAYNEMFCPDYDSLCLPYSSDGQGCDLVLEMFVFSPQRLSGSRDVRRLDVE